VRTQYLDLADFLAVACEVTGLDLDTVTAVANLDMADSALHAPMAGFAGQELYPAFVDKAAVLLVRLAKNHPLPDGNKRTAWVCLRLFMETNGWGFDTQPPVDESEAAVLAIAAGQWREEEAKDWLLGFLVRREEWEPGGSR
jgi:death-on-curing protein